jgi:uncharacterized protein (DUF983 family)
MPSFCGALRTVCPRCQQGAIFRARFFAMYERCPVCDLKYEREPGYFVGAMYISYLVGVPLFLMLLGAIWLGTKWPMMKLLLVTFLLFQIFVPLLIRYSRACWLHLDRYLDPDPVEALER